MNYQAINKQSGAVLAISLVLLTAITLLASMNMHRAGLQTRITANILHQELLFNGALNEQEFWFFRLRTTDTGDPVLSAPLRSFDVNATGGRDYKPVVLNTINPANMSNNANLTNTPNITNELVLLGATPGVNALAQGQEAGDRVLYKYQLRSNANFASRSQGNARTESQITGMSFPGLNTSKNSYYSAP